MCGRFTLTTESLATVAERLGLTPSAEQAARYRPRYNIAPGDRCWLVRSREGKLELVEASWGLVNHWARDRRVGYRQINARAETMAEKPAFRSAFERRRALVLADGFYEWQGPKGQREPVWFHAAERAPLYLAGLYESFTEPETGERLRTFTIVTTAANAPVRPLHDRMPLIVAPGDVDRWLVGDDPGTVVRPVPDDLLVGDKASPRLNRVEHDDPDLLDPNDPKVKRQMALF